MVRTLHANAAASQMPLHTTRPMQHYNSLPKTGSNVSAIHREVQMGSTPRLAPPATEHKPFVPSYRLFEDLNVLGNVDKGLNRKNSMSPSLSGTSSQGMVGGRK